MQEVCVMEPLRYPPAPLASVDFDVTFTDGTTVRITVRERRFPGDTASHFEVDGAPGGLSPERAASSWAWHRLMDRSIDGDHTTGIASIRRTRPPPATLPPPAPPKMYPDTLL